MSRQPKIVLFTSPTCSWCTRAKAYFRQNRLAFREVDVSKDRKAAEDMVRRTGQQGVPVVLINNRPVVGFDRQKIEALLAGAGK